MTEAAPQEAPATPAVPAPPSPATPTPPVSSLGRQEPPPPAPPAAPQLPEWMATLPDELKAEKALEPFYGKEPADLAKAFIETKRMVGERVMLPKADDPDSFARFAAAVRPETADAYTIDLAEGAPTDFADHMRPAFYEAGLMPSQVERLVAANNAFIAKQATDAAAAGQEVLGKLESEFGRVDFGRKKLAAVSWLDKMGIPVQFETDLARFVGSENSLRMLFSIAERSGELGKVNETDVQLDTGMMTPETAQAEADRMTKSKDPAMLSALRDPNSPESRRIDQLAAVIASGKK